MAPQRQARSQQRAPRSPMQPVPSTVRHARAAVATCFFLNAVVFANLVPRLPAVKDQLELSNASLGAAIAAVPAGALVAGLLAPACIQRFGSARTASFGLALLAAAVMAVPHAQGWTALATVLLTVGALDSIVDVAQNAHGFRVQRRYGRSIVNAFHGVWSIGAVTGGLLGSAAAGLSVPLATHLVVSGTLFAALALLAHRFMLPGPESAEREVPEGTAPGAPAAVGGAGAGHGRLAGLRGAPRQALVLLAALGALAACGAFVEDAGSSWGALYLRGELGAGAATGGLAFVALQAAMTAGRLTGDRFVNRYGERAVVRVGGLITAAGMGLALAVPSVATAVVGFALAGLGAATLVPAAMHRGDELPGLPDGVGLTIVSWLLRAGFLVSAPLVGVVADLTSLRVGLLSVVLAGVGAVVFGRVLADR